MTIRQISAGKLCFVGEGKKLHLKGNLEGVPITLCGYAWDIEAHSRGLIGISDDYEGLCRWCLKKYKKQPTPTS